MQVVNESKRLEGIETTTLAAVEDNTSMTVSISKGVSAPTAKPASSADGAAKLFQLVPLIGRETRNDHVRSRSSISETVRRNSMGAKHVYDVTEAAKKLTRRIGAILLTSRRQL
jgi:hypothetical protein